MCPAYPGKNFEEHQKVFKPELGTNKKGRPSFCWPTGPTILLKVHMVPFTLQQKVEAELVRLEKHGSHHNSAGFKMGYKAIVPARQRGTGHHFQCF